MLLSPRGWTCLAALTAGGLFTPAMLACDEPSAPVAPADAARKPIATLIADLRSPEFSVREAASAQLFDRDDLSLRQFEDAAHQDGLTLEQRARLGSAARARFAAQPRAAIGVAFAQLNTTIIGQIYDGFPAKAVLLKDDEIVAIDDVEVPADKNIRPYIICHDPGDTVQMTIKRQGERITLAVPLGSFDDLLRRDRPVQSRDEIKPEQMAAAWEVRQSRRAAPTMTPIGIGAVATFDEAKKRENLGPDDPFEQALRRAQDGEWAGIVAGGVSREGEIDRYLRMKLASGPGMMDQRPFVNARAPLNQADLEQQMLSMIKLRDQYAQSVQQMQRDRRDAHPDKRPDMDARIAELARMQNLVNAQIEGLKQRRVVPGRR